MKERACASGGALNGRQLVAVVLETSSTVEIISLTKPVAGGAHFQGNIQSVGGRTEVALGNRTIYDAGRIPRAELR